MTTLQNLSDVELMLARDIEICVGPFHQSDERRKAMHNLLTTFTNLPPTILANLLPNAASAAGFDNL
jgi:hypothetical protein